MRSWDILIVGGGPAGSSCAWGLRDSGLKVAVLDKQVFPRDKVCGGWITPAVLGDLEIDPGCYSSGRTLQPIKAFRTGNIGGKTVVTDYGKPVSYGVRRCEFDDYLLRRTGADLVLGVALTGMQREGDGWVVNGEIRSRLVVGAGGHFCPVARFMGAQTGRESAVVAQETEFEMDPRQATVCQVRSETPELYFCPDMKGYGWCFRKGTYLNIGLGRADSHGLSEHVKGFLRFLKSEGRIPFDVPRLRGHAYLLRGTSTRTPLDDQILLIGDAAGLAHAQSGEGILPAVESGLLAAKAILAANGDYSRHGLASYDALFQKVKPSLALAASRHLPPGTVAFVARQLLKTQWFARNIVLDSWFLHARPSSLLN